MKMSAFPQLSPRFGKIRLEDGWDKSNQATAISSQNQENRRDAYNSLAPQVRYLEEKFSTLFTYLEEQFDADVVIETEANALKQGQNIDGYRVNIISRNSNTALIEPNDYQTLTAYQGVNGLSLKIERAINKLKENAQEKVTQLAAFQKTLLNSMES